MKHETEYEFSCFFRGKPEVIEIVICCHDVVPTTFSSVFFLVSPQGSWIPSRR